MSEGEIAFAFLSLSSGLISLLAWVRRFRSVPFFVHERNLILPLRLLLPISIALMVFVLSEWADKQVRDSFAYIWTLAAFGVTWMTVSSASFAWLGLSVGDDAFERRNPAAIIAAIGGVLGQTFIYCGGNVGDGPSLWNNIFFRIRGHL